MQRSCTHCSASFGISKDDLQFYDDISPVFGDKKCAIPPPTLCPACRFQRRLLMRNDRHLYHRKSSLSGKQIISIYAPEKEFPVYDQDEWWSDRWDPKAYGRDIDFSKPFYDQVQELRLTVPRISLLTTGVENSYYTNHALFLKNCYLVFGGGHDEDCMFSNYISFSKDTLDGLCLYSCERCYEGVSSQRCYECLWFMNCRDCTSCLMIEDCESCKNCIGCFGLHRKEYCILNNFVGKEGFEKMQRELLPLTHGKIDALRERFDALKATLPHRSAHTYASENCTGDAVYNSKNSFDCFDVTDCEDCKHIAFTPKGIRSQDATFTSPDGVDHNYFVGSTVGAPRSAFTFMVWYGSDVYCSIECHHCQNCFGCAGLRNAKHCILNKQYTKEQYDELVPKIIEQMKKFGEWGEFFPLDLCPYGYNETNAVDYFPLTKEQALAHGFSWRDESDQQETYLGPKPEIPETITDVGDDICTKILVCEATGRPFKIIPQELKFYRSMGLPLPKRCFDERHKDRILRRNPRKLWARDCAKCKEEMQTTYSPEKPQIVYCERCYLETVY